MLYGGRVMSARGDEGSSLFSRRYTRKGRMQITSPKYGSGALTNLKLNEQFMPLRMIRVHAGVSS